MAYSATPGFSYESVACTFGAAPLNLDKKMVERSVAELCRYDGEPVVDRTNLDLYWESVSLCGAIWFLVNL